MPYLSPRTLTEDEQRRVLAVTAGHPRDHLVFSVALGTGLRLAEIVGLNVGDVYSEDGATRPRVALRTEITKGRRRGDVFLPAALVSKLVAYREHKKARCESLHALAPIFCSQSRSRISKRRVQDSWRRWQVRSGFAEPYRFHALRHTAITNVYRATRDLFLAQRFARHASPLTTTMYTHPSDHELATLLSTLNC